MQVDTHSRAFKIAAHIRDAEAEQLLAYRLRAEAAPSLVTAFAAQISPTSSGAAAADGALVDVDATASYCDSPAV